ncbi:MAG: polysaccharide ABC transporter ATP-binding protein [Woeseiaceae bacterium]
MSDSAIIVDNLSKVYRIGVQGEANDSFGRAVFDFLRSPFKNYRKYRSLYRFSEDELSNDYGGDDILWALRDVSFRVDQGEVVGIIGVNGAGKSTLLKVISNITPPTKGRITIRGRVSSLLEVGTGFHPELTGRENVYLNGTILGMRKIEVDRKFDEIVDFAGVEKFLDTPVKRYSMGMRVRLAFAVAAHLEPETLIIDEVLAVGDAEFQKKCLSKMEDVGKEGRTVLFVSHNMAAITRLCRRGILLSAGSVIADGETHEVVSHYLTSGLGTAATREWPDIDDAPGDESVRLRSVRVTDQDGATTEGIDIRHPVGIVMEYEVLKGEEPLMPYLSLTNEEGVIIFSSIDQEFEWHSKPRSPGRYVSTAWIPGNLLSEGMVYVSVAMRTQHRKYRPFQVGDTVAFNVIDRMEGGSARGEWVGRLTGAVRPKLDWTTSRSADEGRTGG